MQISGGTRLGQYEIVERLGAGGMGEVWLAEDTRLGRKVAIKVLPPELGADPDRLARLEREARLLAQLSHPNIATVYGFESQDDVHYVAMELAPGAPLDELLAAGPLEQDRVREIALQVTRALESAHERGVIHRDLKPANIVVDPEGGSGTSVKVLDFGLAKAFEPDGSVSSLSPELTASPTVVAATAAGVILGTAAYMSPEQARGKAVDKRADIWAFGVVLYEMLAGERLFEGETVSDVLAAVLRQELDLDRLPLDTSPTLRRLLGRCLERDPQQRLRDIGEARIVLSGDEAGETVGDLPEADRPAWSPRTLLVAALTALALGLFLGGRGDDSAGGTLHVGLDVAPAERLVAEDYELRPVRSAFVVTPDGESVIFSGSLDGTVRLYRRRLDETVARPLPGTEGARNVILSPDGAEVAFMAQGELRRLALDGAAPRTIADIADLHERLPSPTGGFTPPDRNLYGMTWSDDGHLYLARFEGGLVRVPERGGEAAFVAGTEEHRYLRNPHALPGGSALLFDATVDDATPGFFRQLVQWDLDSGSSRVLLENAADPEYVPGVGLLFWRSGDLHVIGFDADEARTSGVGQLLAEDVLIGVGGPAPGHMSATAQYATGGDTFLYATGGRQRTIPAQLELIGPDGDRTPLELPSPGGGHFGPGVIDADRVLVTWRPDDTGGFTAGILDLQRNTFTQLTPEHSWYTQPDPTRDRALAERDGLRAVPLDGSGGFERIADRLEGMGDAYLRAFVHRVAPDGSLLAMLVNRDETEGDVVLFDLEGEGGFKDFAATPAAEGYPSFSPDSRWVVYTSDASGRDEVYVSRLEGGGRLQVSTEGGMAPLFSPDGESITYWVREPGADSTLYRVPVTLGPEPSAGQPERLFSAPYSGLVGLNNYDVLPDGRFVVTVRGQGQDRPVRNLRMILGWREYVEGLRAE